MLRLPACLPLLVAASLPLVAGCSSNLPEMAEASGTVMYQGKPVEGAQVTFTQADAPRAATGTTDAQGKFTLTTFDEGDGAVLGQHVVTVVKAEPTSGGDMSASDPSSGYEQAMAGAAKKPKPESELPEKYADPATSDLKAEVTDDGDNEFTFNLE